MEIIICNNIKFYKIKNFKDYYISKCGKVYSKIKYRGKGGILSTSDVRAGYRYAPLWNGNK